jgi:serine/threonine-protein kinase
VCSIVTAAAWAAPAQAITYSQTALPFTGLNEPFGVAVDGSGDVFAADAVNNQVVRTPRSRRL